MKIPKGRIIRNYDTNPKPGLLHELAEIRSILLTNEEGTPIYEKYLMLCVPSEYEIKNLAKARMEERNKYREALKKIADYSPDMNGFVGPVAREALNQ